MEPPEPGVKNLFHLISHGAGFKERHLGFVPMDWLQLSGSAHLGAARRWTLLRAQTPLQNSTSSTVYLILLLESASVSLFFILGRKITSITNSATTKASFPLEWYWTAKLGLPNPKEAQIFTVLAPDVHKSVPTVYLSI